MPSRSGGASTLLMLIGLLAASAYRVPPSIAGAISCCGGRRSNVCRAMGPAKMCDGGDDAEMMNDLNWIQTRLHVALDAEDYVEAAALRDRIRRITGAGAGVEAAWSTLGVPDWLADRLDRLNFPLPTRVQLHSLRAMETGEDAAVCAPTGSGKTLSYLVPLLVQLSDDLLSEDLSDFLAGFLDGGRSAARRAKGQRRRRAATDGEEAKSGGALNDLSVPTPAVMIVVPTRELGVQVSMLTYRLLGGGTTNPTIQPYNHPSRFQPGGKANMFSYKGPRHVKVAGLWDEQAYYAAAFQDQLKGVHVIIGTPEHLSRVAVGDNLRLQNVRGLVIDEADACLNDEASKEQMALLLRRMEEARAATSVPPPQTILAGASLSPRMVQRAVSAGWVRAPTLVSEFGWIDRGCDLEAIARASDTATADADDAAAGGALAGWTEQRVPAGSSHEYIVCEPKDAVAVLCRVLRERFEGAAESSAAGEPPPRVVIFASNADQAVRLASQLQGALFGTLSGDASSEGLWGLSVLLPSAEARLEGRTGDDDVTLSVLESSLRVMEMYACNKTSVLVTTAAATRGLDFPQVTDVLNLGIVGSAADYVHRAGRVGRVGQLARGSVVSVLCAAEVADLLSLGRELHFTPRERPAPNAAEPLSEGMSREDQVQALSDVFNLLDIDEPNADGAA